MARTVMFARIADAISQRTGAPWPAVWKARTVPDDVAEPAWRDGPG